MGGEFGGKWIYVYVWLSPCVIHLKLSQYCLIICYTPRQNKMLIKLTSPAIRHVIFCQNIHKFNLIRWAHKENSNGEINQKITGPYTSKLSKSLKAKKDQETVIDCRDQGSLTITDNVEFWIVSWSLIQHWWKNKWNSNKICRLKPQHKELCYRNPEGNGVVNSSI